MQNISFALTPQQVDEYGSKCFSDTANTTAAVTASPSLFAGEAAADPVDVTYDYSCKFDIFVGVGEWEFSKFSRTFCAFARF